MPRRPDLLLLVGLALTPLVATNARAECPRACAADEKPDPVTGCCDGDPEPADTRPTDAATPTGPAEPVRAVDPRPCPAGKERGPDTAGQCCWPGQTWLASGRRCSGKPTSCPEDHEPKGESCKQVPCDYGKARSPDTVGRCCWKGQAWSVAQRRCTGPPKSCPAYLVTTADACVQDLDWVKIPAGTFTMGDTHGDGASNQKPTRSVTLSAFRMARTETTVAQYEACVSAGTCTVPAPKCSSSSLSTWGGREPGSKANPVNCVTWDQASEFCRWIGGRLPTEAEWEYAARGTDGRKFPWGESPGRIHIAFGGSHSRCAHKLCGEEETTFRPVGTFFRFGRSPFGLDDMAGNVSEWVADWYGPYDGSATSPPAGPDSGERRVVRGSSIFGKEEQLRTTHRRGVAPHQASIEFGFRCAGSP